MHKLRSSSLFIGLILTSAGVSTAGQNPTPKIALVLSGGGARGAAHIGVLEVLERERIPIDYIVDTSFGALVGGLYSLGYSAEEIEGVGAEAAFDTLLDPLRISGGWGQSGRFNLYLSFGPSF